MKKYLYFILLIFVMSACSSNEDVVNDIPTDYKENVVNPDYVNIDWDKTKLIKANPAKGEFTFSNNSVTNQLHEGNVLTIDADTTGYLVVVTQAMQDANGNVCVKTKQGDLCDIFANTEFTLALSPNSATRSGDGKNVFYPVKYVFLDSVGKSHTRSTLARDYAKQNLLHCDTDMANNPKSVLYKSDHAKAYFEKAQIEMDLDMCIQTSFGLRSKSQVLSEGRAQYRSKTLGVKTYVQGDVNTDFLFRIDASYNKVFKEKGGDYEIIGHNIIRPVSVLFNVGPVPVWVKLNADLYRGDYLELDGQLTYKMGFKTSSQAKFGLDWSQQNGAKPICDFNQETEIVYPTIEGQGRMTGRAYLFPRIFVSLYSVIGPSFDIKPYLGVEAKGGVRFTASPSYNPDDYMAFSLRDFIGVDGVAALSLKMFDYNYEIERIETKPFNLLEWDLYNSPSRIMANTPYLSITPGQKETVTFTVYDTDILRKLVPTPLRQVVKFESNGILSSSYGFTDLFKDGVVSVDWTPVSKDDYLKAILYAPDGTVIDEAIIGTKKEEGEKLLTGISNGHGGFTFQYDNKGRVTHISTPDGKTTIGYDPFSVISTDYDDNGTATTKCYDFKFNDAGRITSCRAKSSDGESWTETFSYNKEGRLTENTQTYDDGFVDKMILEWKNGNLKKMTDTGYDGSKVEETESYTMTYGDPVNYKGQVSYSQMMGSFGFVAYSTSNIWGNLCSAKLPTAVHSYYKYYGSGYDEDEDVDNYTFSYTYDDNNYITSETYKSTTYGESGVVYYTYDNAPASVAKKMKKKSNVKVKKHGRRTRRHPASLLLLRMR